VVALCLPGNKDTNELCRQENDSLLPTIQFFRNRQNNANFKLSNGDKLSMADILVLGAATAVHSCSGGELTIEVAIGRVDATSADDVALPSPGGLIEDKHNSIFQSMGLNKVSMRKMVGPCYPILVALHGIRRGDVSSSSRPLFLGTVPWLFLFLLALCTNASQPGCPSCPYQFHCMMPCTLFFLYTLTAYVNHCLC
jgi:hypothetical protein